MKDPGLLTAMQVSIVTAAIDLIPLLVALFCWQHIKRLKILVSFCMMAFITDIMLIYFAYHAWPNIGVVTLFSWLEFTLLSYLFAGWQSNLSLKRILQWGPFIMPLWMLFWLVGYDPGVVLCAAKVSECIVLAAVALQTLHVFSRDPQTPGRIPKFWISGGVLLYFAGNASVFTAYLLLEIRDSALLHLALNVVANIFYSLAFLTQRTSVSGSFAPRGQETPGFPA